MIGIRKLPKHRRNGRHQEEEDHDDAVHGEQLVVRIGGDEIRLRRQQLQPNEACERSTNKEEERNRDEVEHRDTLVISREQPAQQTMPRSGSYSSAGSRLPAGAN